MIRSKMTLQETIANLEEEILSKGYETLDYITKLRAHVYGNATSADYDYYEMLLGIMEKHRLKAEAVVLNKKVKDLTDEDFSCTYYFEDLDDVFFALSDVGISKKQALNMKLSTALAKCN